MQIAELAQRLKDKGGPCSRIGDLRSGAGFRQLPERVYLPAAERLIGRAAALGVPRLPATNPQLRQHPGSKLVDPAGPLPELQN